MKNRNLIVIGALIIVIVLGVWVYLLFFGAPNTIDEVFTNFEQDETQVVFPTDDTSTQDTAPQPTPDVVLQKITDRPVVAAVFMEGVLRYIEQGTGYIYDVNIESGEETQITNTTIPRLHEAIFSKSGNRVALTSETEGVRTTVVGTITKDDLGEGIINGVSLPEGSRNLAFSDTGLVVFYLIENRTGATGYSYNITEQTQTILFSIPLSDVVVLWGDTTYIYTKPTHQQRGYIYQLENSALSFVRPGSAGLTAAIFNDTLLLTETSNRSIATYKMTGGGFEPSALRLFLEKCSESNTATSTLYCAAPQSIHQANYPDDWYKGVVSFSDSLWTFDIIGNTGERHSTFSELIEEEIDVMRLGSNTNDTFLYLINKNDNSLWLYNTTLD